MDLWTTLITSIFWISMCYLRHYPNGTSGQWDDICLHNVYSAMEVTKKKTHLWNMGAIDTNNSEGV